MEQLIDSYMELEQQMRAKTEEIKAAAKAQAMAHVTACLSNGRGDDARLMIDRLDNLEKLKLVTNTAEIIDTIKKMANEKAPQALQVNNSKLAKVMQTTNGDIKELMEARGYVFLNKLQGQETMRFEKESEYFYLYLLDSLADTEQIEQEINEASKYCNLVYIVPTEDQKEHLKLIISQWANTKVAEATKKYLKIQVSSIEKLQQLDSVLEKMKLGL